MRSHPIDEQYVETTLELTEKDVPDKETCEGLLEEVQMIAASYLTEFVKNACLHRWTAAHSNSTIFIYEAAAWERVFEKLKLEDRGVRSVLESMHAQQSHDVLVQKTLQDGLSPHEPIGVGERNRLLENPYENALVIETGTQFELGRQVEFWDLQFLLQEGLSPAEALDYVAVRKHERSQVNWADARGVSHQAVSKNVSQAIEKFNKRTLGRDVNRQEQGEESKPAEKVESTEWSTFSPSGNEDDETNHKFDIDWSERTVHPERKKAFEEKRQELSNRMEGLDNKRSAAWDTEPSVFESNRNEEVTLDTERSEESAPTSEGIIDWEATAKKSQFTATELESEWDKMLGDSHKVYHPFLDRLTDELGPDETRAISTTYAQWEALTDSQLERIVSVLENQLQKCQ